MRSLARASGSAAARMSPRLVGASRSGWGPCSTLIPIRSAVLGNNPLIASKQPMAIPDREKWSAVIAFSFATFIVLLGTLILLSAVFASQATLVALFGA